MKATNKYRYCNHHHELTKAHKIVNFGTGKFVANKMAIPLLRALNKLGLITRTHHVDKSGGFFSIILNDKTSVEIKAVFEKDATRKKFNGQQEILISWRSQS